MSAKRKDLVYEIGTEEIPAGYLPPALAQLRRETEALFAAERIVPESVEAHATPRRIVLLVTGLPERQEDRTEEMTGPPWKAAFDADGNPTKAAEGFARGKGLDVADLRKVETERGPYAGATVPIPGEDTAKILARELPRLTRNLAFPKTMRWGPERTRFARPIRWLLALFGPDVVPFAIEGVATDRFTFGHRILARGPFEVKSAGRYEAALEKGRVTLRAAVRAARIETLLAEAARTVGGTLVPDADLVDEVSYLVEAPSVVCGSFDPEFLELPAPVIATAMRDHQRYFAVAGADGKLLSHFLCVANSATEAAERVIDGNERVLRARLDDARFYWNEDLRTSLEEKVPRLERVVWLEGYGSLLDKTARIRKLAAALAAKSDEDVVQAVDRAALLSKADLVTDMIRDGKEFTALQGVIGREYARRQGESEDVARALEEQYRPRFAGDELPESEAGACLALADRLDTLAGVWAAGLKPTGSKDPFALRRIALGIVRILLDRGLDVSVRDLLTRAAGEYGDAVSDPEAVAAEAAEFVRERLAGHLTGEERFEADVVAAVCAAGGDSPLDIRSRAVALQELLRSRREDFEALAAGFKRARNILKKETAAGDPEAGLIAEDAERALFEAFLEVDGRVRAAAAEHRYEDAFRDLAGLRGPIDEFFDRVLVLAEDPALRRNRLRLLGRIVDRVEGLADLSRLAVPEEQRV